jgi:hypothetical protein
MGCLGWHKTQPCALCGTHIKGLTHLFDCSNIPLIARTSRLKLSEMLARLGIPRTPLEVLNCPSAISSYCERPVDLLTELAEFFSALYLSAVRALAASSMPPTA